MNHKLLKKARKLKGLTLEQLAEDVHISVSQLSRFESGGRRPRADEIQRIAARLDVSAAELLGEAARDVTLIGYVGLGAAVHFFVGDQVSLATVKGYDGAPENTVALETRGTSLTEIFDGWLAYYDDISSTVTPDMIGQPCVIWLETGEILVRKVLIGTIPGTYTLRANFDPPLYDVKIAQAARIRHLQPR